MPTKRVIQAGHFLSMVFVALLLTGAREYWGAHPLISGVLLAAFAVSYYAAARVIANRQFLYPAVLLGMFAYHLMLAGAGLPLTLQPLFSLISLTVFTAFAVWDNVAEPKGSRLSLYGANAILIGAMTIWILFRLNWFYQQAPLATAAAVAGFGAYCWLRFWQTGETRNSFAMALLATGAFLVFLYRYPSIALLVATVGALLMAASSYRRIANVQRVPYFVACLYLVYKSAGGAAQEQIALGYLALSAFWLYLALALNRGEKPDILGPRPALLPRLLPLVSAGILLALAPVVLWYPWKPIATAVDYLAIFALIFADVTGELVQRSMSLMGIGLARLMAGLSRIAPLAALAYVAADRFPAGYGVALGALCLSALSVLWASREQPKLLVRRSFYAYQGGLFLILAWFLAERRASAAGSPMDLLSGAIAVFAVVLAARLLRNRLSSACELSLYEIASVASITAAVLYSLGSEIEPFTALQLGMPLLLVSAFAWFATFEISVLFSVPVVLGLWLYLAQSMLGVRGEWLGVAYLITGLAGAVAGYRLLSRQNSWYRLFYFIWFVSAAVSVGLFSPFHAAGAWLAPLWPVSFLLVARAPSSRRDPVAAWTLEGASALLALASAGILVWQQLYAPAALALLIYAALYAWVAARYRVWCYVYPVAACVVAAFHLELLAIGRLSTALPLFLPVAVVLSIVAARLRRQHPRFATPLDLGAAAGAALASAILICLPFGQMAAAGGLSGIAYLALYIALNRWEKQPVFLAGAGLAATLAVLEFLPMLPGVSPENRIAFLIPAALVLVFLGWWRRSVGDTRGGWALDAAAMTIAVAASTFVLWPVTGPEAARIVLMVALGVWLALLVETRREIFIYCATMTLAMLAYHFVENTGDVFGRHLVAFFLYGTALLGLVFLAAISRDLVRFRRPTLFLPVMHWRQRLLYLLPVAVLGLATFGGWGVTASSNPIFCGTCHEMKAYFTNWKASPHAKSEIGCPACHYEPGISGFAKAKIQGFSQLVVSLTGSSGTKPAAHVDDRTCLSSGCHSTDQLAGARYVRRVFYFNHATHLRNLVTPGHAASSAAKPWHGPELRCTSCHTDVGPESHFAVDTNACITCHFQAASDPSPSVAGVGCVACHGVPKGERGSDRFEHAAAGVTANDAACDACHGGLTRGTVAVEDRRAATVIWSARRACWLLAAQ